MEVDPYSLGSPDCCLPPVLCVSTCFSFQRTHKGDHVEYLYLMESGQVSLNTRDGMGFLTSQKCISRVV